MSFFNGCVLKYLGVMSASYFEMVLENMYSKM